jgi:predicted dehydrogenase
VPGNRYPYRDRRSPALASTLPRFSRRAFVASATAATLQAQSRTTISLGRKVRVALLGTVGHPGEITGPAGSLPDVELVAVYDPDPAALDRFSRRRGMASVTRYSDYRRMLDTEEIDVVGVCNSNGPRAAAILACLERNLHVAAEKPLALTRDDLAAIRAAHERAGTGLTMLLPMRYSSPYLGLKQVVDSGEIGEVCQIASQKSYKGFNQPAWKRNRETYGGTIPWIGVHMIDLMRWASGSEFRDVYSRAAHIGYPEIGDMENVTTSLFTLENGGLATLRMDYLRPAKAKTHGDDRLRIAGTTGVVEYQAGTGLTVVSSASESRRVTELPPPGSVFTDFLRTLYLGAPPSLSNDDIFRVTEITIAAQEAVESRTALMC